jgi:hypothetical protein
MYTIRSYTKKLWQFVGLAGTPEESRGASIQDTDYCQDANGTFLVIR